MTSPADALNDAQLIDRVRENDAGAFAELRGRHQSDALRTARMLAYGPNEAEVIAAVAFERLHAALVTGHGPRAVVSPYLRTMIRRGALDTHRTPGDDYEAVDPAAVEDLPHSTDPLTGVEERDIVREAYESLPERWQRALWFTEIEHRTPASLVPDLGSAAGAVAAMAYRAREGLRQAYLAVHLSVAVSDECQPVVTKLPAYVREALVPEDDVMVAIHLDACLDCRNRRYELLLLVSNLRSVLAPALLRYSAGSPAATRPVAGRGGAAPAVGVGASRAARTSAIAAMTAGSIWRRLAVKVGATAAVSVLATAALVWAASSFAPTMPADALDNDRGIPLTMPVERSSVPGPAATLNPSDLLEGVPSESKDEPVEDDSTAGIDTESTTEPADDTIAGTGDDESAAADSSNTSGPIPESSSTADTAGDGAAAGAGGETSEDGAGDGGTQDPSNGSDSDPGEEPAPPAGDGDGDSDDDADEPTEKPDDSPDQEEQDEPGLVKEILCLVLC